MKKMLLILVQILICLQMAGQTKNNTCFLTNTLINESKGSIKNLSLKSYLIARKEYKKSSSEKYTPKISLDLLDGSGIYLFTSPKMGPIPAINVGARINAGIKITI